MTLTVFGITLHEFDVGLTDLILAIFCIYWLLLLLKNTADRSAIIIFWGLISSSILGAVFHFFFPLKAETTAGAIMWVMVAVSIGLIIFGMLKLIIGSLNLKSKFWQTAPYVYVVLYLSYFSFISYAFPSIILFYGPTVTLLGLVAFIKFLKGEQLYKHLLIGVILTLIAAGVQVLKLDIHPQYFNFNSLYHTIQLVGLYYFYHFFKTQGNLSLKR